jgi:hypothetical protein
MNNKQHENLKNDDTNRSISSLNKIPSFVIGKECRANNKHNSKELNSSLFDWKINLAAAKRTLVQETQKSGV